MIVRAIDGTRDWQFGKGKNDYKKDLRAVSQNISTRLYSFLGNCFFDQGAGIDWFNLLGAKDQVALNLAISATILNTEAVTALLQLSTNLSTTRDFTVSYRVNTVYSVFSDTFLFQTNEVG